MTEEKWLKLRSTKLLLSWLEGRASERKLRLFAVACCRRLGESLFHPCLADAVEVAERFADDEATDAERAKASLAAFETSSVVPSGAYWGTRYKSAFACGSCAGKEAFSSASHSTRDTVAVKIISTGNEEPDRSDRPEAVKARHAARTAEYEAQSVILRDIFGNPFQPVAFDPSWRTSTAVAVAKGMYDSRNFAPMPLLADALQDAGCVDERILDHCRGPGPHVKGCWVVDLALGKQ